MVKVHVHVHVLVHYLHKLAAFFICGVGSHGDAICNMETMAVALGDSVFPPDNPTDGTRRGDDVSLRSVHCAPVSLADATARRANLTTEERNTPKARIQITIKRATKPTLRKTASEPPHPQPKQHRGKPNFQTTH